MTPTSLEEREALSKRGPSAAQAANANEIAADSR
jgi:hypothetical protein